MLPSSADLFISPLAPTEARAGALQFTAASAVQRTMSSIGQADKNQFIFLAQEIFWSARYWAGTGDLEVNDGVISPLKEFTIKLFFLTSLNVSLLGPNPTLSFQGHSPQYSYLKLPARCWHCGSFCTQN